MNFILHPWQMPLVIPDASRLIDEAVRRVGSVRGTALEFLGCLVDAEAIGFGTGVDSRRRSPSSWASPRFSVVRFCQVFSGCRGERSAYLADFERLVVSL